VLFNCGHHPRHAEKLARRRQSGSRVFERAQHLIYAAANSSLVLAASTWGAAASKAASQSISSAVTPG
jgi:hypothetical protein